jgi:integrase
MSAQLTFKRIQALSKPGRYFDGGTGLHLLVRAPDKKYWVFRHTQNGKRHDLGLGAFPRVSLSDARKRTQEARVMVDSGECPIKAKINAKAAQNRADAPPITFHTFACDWLESKRQEWRNQKHAEQWLYTLNQFSIPVIGSKAPNEIDTEDILKILRPIWSTKTETASRLRGRLERILAAATTRGLRSGANPAAWRGHLDTLLPAPRKVTKVVHHPALPYKELPAFIERLQGRDAVAALALELLILSASRTGEVIGAKRVEVVGDVWTIPASRMKADRPHRVPLTPRMLAIINAAKANDTQSEYLFSRNGKPLSNMAMSTLLKRMGLTVTVHGFRSCFRDWIAEETQHPGEVAEAALAHVIGCKTEGAYRRGDVLQVRRRMMLDWEAFLQPQNKLVQP